jgi:hypothetical protein
LAGADSGKLDIEAGNFSTLLRVLLPVNFASLICENGVHYNSKSIIGINSRLINLFWKIKIKSTLFHQKRAFSDLKFMKI